MSEQKRQITRQQTEKKNGSGTFTVKPRFRETDREAIARKLPHLRKQMRQKIQDGTTGEVVGKITCEIVERKPFGNGNKEILTVRWEIAEIC